MSEQPPALGKRLFGYRRSAVNQMLSDRGVMLRQAEGRVRAAEATAARLEGELADLQESKALLEQQVKDLQADAHDPDDDAAGAEVTSRFMNEELATVLTAAEESAGRIIERARASTQEQVEEAERVWREAQGQLARFGEWRDLVGPALQSALARIEEVRTRIEEVPDQIRQALAPLAESVATLDGDLAELSGASTPPLILSPEALAPPTGDGEEAAAEESGAQEGIPASPSEVPEGEVEDEPAGEH